MLATNYPIINVQVAGFGNPLLDISVVSKDLAVDILKKHNLQLDGQKEVDDTNFQDILDTLNRNDVAISYNPGGCAQNTMRIIQALIKYPKVCAFFGGLGNDRDGKFVEEEVKKSGVETRYTKHHEYSTGRVAALINGANRCLIANLGAANIYNMEHFLKQENTSIIEKVSIVYIEGFFITHSFEVALKVAELGHCNGAVIVFNISGAYVAENYSEYLTSMISISDIIIGNCNEFKALAKVLELQYSSVGNLVRQIHSTISHKSPENSLKFKLKHLEKSGKTVVLTQGKDPVLAINNNTFVDYKIPILNGDLIKDSTGAGDAFTAGFLVGLLQEKTLEDSVSFGCKVAQAIIQQIGVQLPQDFQTVRISST